MILDEIVEYKREFVKKAKNLKSVEKLIEEILEAPQPQNFYKALRANPEEISVIAEIKKASPSKGIIRPDFNPVSIGEIYNKSGADAISILTDEKYFQGSLEYVKEVRKRVSIPVLRKEFIIDTYQIYEARAAGADAILLIAAILDDKEMDIFYTLVKELGMSALVEVHTREELERSLKVSPEILGINNRNLKNFTVDLNQTIRLREYIPEEICVVSESGIKTREDINLLMKNNIQAVLVGEAFMRVPDPGKALKELKYG
jgi:indole-3-glycerol phosphate synthase